MNKISTLTLLILTCIFIYGFSPTEEVLKKENADFEKILTLQENIKNTDTKCIDLINKDIKFNGFLYSIYKEDLNPILSKHKENIIKNTNNYLCNNCNVYDTNTSCHATNTHNYDTTLSDTTNLNQQNNMLKNSNIYTNEIDFLFFNTLMAFPEKALNHSNNFKNIYDEEKLTINEFSAILNELYKNNYIIIDIFDIIKINNNTITKKELILPQNKKPIILCFDNVSYKSNYQNLGEIDKLIIDRNNNIATYTTKKSIQDRIQYNNEFVVILEEFINTHPDFSYNNARGIIFFAGEDGILGYNTNHKNASCKTETKKVSEVIKKLKSLGWRFGCNNYTYNSESTKSEFQFTKELALWQKEISPIIGGTYLYSHPYGDSSNNQFFNQLLLDNHFKIFFKTQEDNSILNQDYCSFNKTEINGNTLRNNSEELSPLFNCEKVYDHTNRTNTFYNNKKGE